MNFLVDTHIFLWFVNDNPRLSIQNFSFILFWM